MKQLTVLLPALIVGAVFFSPVAAHADDTPGSVTVYTTFDCDDETITDTELDVSADGTQTTYISVRYVMIGYEFENMCPGLVFVIPSDEEQGGQVTIQGVVATGSPIPVPDSPSHSYPKPPSAPTTPSDVTPAPVVAPAPATVPAVVVPVSDPPKIGLYGDWKVLGG